MTRDATRDVTRDAFTDRSRSRRPGRRSSAVRVRVRGGAGAGSGQVYRGRLRGMPAGQEVAVKVRPGRTGAAREVTRDVMRDVVQTVTRDVMRDVIQTVTLDVMGTEALRAIRVIRAGRRASPRVGSRPGPAAARPASRCTARAVPHSRPPCEGGGR